MITPYLNFQGRAAEAMAFYESVFHCTDKKMLTFADIPGGDIPITDENKHFVLFGEMTISGTKVSFSDTQPDVNPWGMISLSLQLDSEAEVLRVYDALKEGGQVLMPCEPQFFSPLYAWVNDKFGIGWQISHAITL